MDDDADSCEGLGSVAVDSERDGGGFRGQVHFDDEHSVGDEKPGDHKYAEVLHSACMGCNDDWHRVLH